MGLGTEPSEAQWGLLGGLQFFSGRTRALTGRCSNSFMSGGTVDGRMIGRTPWDVFRGVTIGSVRFKLSVWVNPVKPDIRAWDNY